MCPGARAGASRRINVSPVCKKLTMESVIACCAMVLAFIGASGEYIYNLILMFQMSKLLLLLKWLYLFYFFIVIV